MTEPMTSPSRAEARYLETIATLGGDRHSVAAAAVARSLDLSAPTVHEMLRRLSRDGYIERAAARGWQLTATGRHEAAAVRRRRSVVERFLRTQTTIPSEEIAEEADHLLAAISPKLEQHLRLASWTGERPCDASPVGDRVRTTPTRPAAPRRPRAAR
ncbi:metal-dependent transcriptional regulator [Conexibacter sp. CPCC 206217]|uniref:metal-dependent transcriptional regulator n=1 Tax=Conexibacter sp. CPCC 206217 TaxID=3064574 RepID=UPI002727A349|nr:iron dependent repressor, metal binding and dimerization domain protein [Conexibacter sp. CPCC 206217]MDO8210875.1 iron dependent repressor, metal binding and dimerization domain protein [Conexibacter sp. CPCC 206217]